MICLDGTFRSVAHCRINCRRRSCFSCEKSKVSLFPFVLVDDDINNKSLFLLLSFDKEMILNILFG